MKAATRGAVCLLGIVGAITCVAGSKGAPKGAAQEAGTIHAPAFDLPSSSFLDAQSKAAMLEDRSWAQNCPIGTALDAKTIASNRACLQKYYYIPLAKTFAERYPVSIESARMAGVRVDVISPADGVLPRNQQRILINLHGGAFLYGELYGGQIESIPIAAVGRIKVVSVDYRMAPEYQFPAGTEDVVAVYRTLMKTYAPENIGIYGCSAGATLTAQTVAYLLKAAIPTPGAIGMFGGGAHPFEGDSARITQALFAYASTPASEHPYSRNISPDDPAFFPGKSREIMSRFPPSILMSSTRDLGLSSVVVTHAQLVQLGVHADLHVWEGVGHCFLFNPDLQASREAYDVVARFFDEHLGAQ